MVGVKAFSEAYACTCSITVWVINNMTLFAKKIFLSGPYNFYQNTNKYQKDNLLIHHIYAHMNMQWCKDLTCSHNFMQDRVKKKNGCCAVIKESLVLPPNDCITNSYNIPLCDA